MATQIKLNQKERCLELVFNQGDKFKYPCQLLREQAGILSGQVYKEKDSENVANINIVTIEPQGNYGLIFCFDDGYQQGVFTWEKLYDIALEHSL
ncbi:MAG: DUF971 domain-containing protein [Gammaproteobacteria bacterium]|nr:DUF971 domain-containing protein [Gammaproteobacteria bacterium]